MQEFEFDKIVVAIALGLLSLVFSYNVGNFLYGSMHREYERGFVIEVPEEESGGVEKAKRGLPDVLDMHAIMAVADAIAGEKIFTKCLACHTNQKGQPDKIGPNLWGVVGAQIATRSPDFAYSKAMKERSDKAWDYEELYRYLYAPKAHVPGTKMSFAGIKNDVDRADLIAYLRTLSSSPLPLP